MPASVVSTNGRTMSLPASRHTPLAQRLQRSTGHGMAVVRAAGKDRQGKDKGPSVEYGANWYEATRELGAKSRRTVREELEYRRAANLAANNGKERKDLYTDNWDGSEWKGSGFNILTLVSLLFVLVPVAGLVFAYMTYGVLWG